jgi:hypothetical protein
MTKGYDERTEELEVLQSVYKDAAARVTLKMTIPWMPIILIQSLQGAALTLWEEVGHTQMVYSYLLTSRRKPELFSVCNNYPSHPSY